MIDAINSGGGPDVAGLYDAARGSDTEKRLSEIKGQDREEAARQMEAFFMQTLLKEMRQTLPEGGFFGKGPGTHVLQGMFEQMLAEDIARGEGVGMRQFILDSLPPEGIEPGSIEKSKTEASVDAPPSADDAVSNDATVTLPRTEGRDAR